MFETSAHSLLVEHRIGRSALVQRRGCTLLMMLVGSLSMGCIEGGSGGGDGEKSDTGTPCSGVDDSVDGVDQDCNGVDGVDNDGDGYADAAAGGDDCDDTDPDISPGATETWYDGVDADCDGADDFDADGDGYTSADHEGDDCDDTSSDVHPGAEEDYSDEVDHDCDGEIDRAESACTSNLVLTTSEGDALPIDGCVEWDLTATFEFDPDDPPELRTFSLSLDATDDPEFECTVTIEQTNICGEGYYVQSNVAPGTTVVTTLDCSGVEDADETIFTGTGYLLIQAINTGSDAGSFAGLPLYTGISATLSVADGDLSLTGDFSVGAIQIAGDSEEETDCAVSDGDEDDDGDIDAYYDGGDCNDNDPYTYTSAAELEDPSACMRDEDGDGWGDATPGDGITSGTDCDDTDDSAYTGVAANEPELCTWDADGDGYGNANAPSPLDPGGDCDDDDPTAYTGAASAESELCTVDVDGDGFGDRAATAPLDAGTDCNDADSAEFPGAVTEATGGECMLDADGDGYGDKGATGLYDVGTDCNDADNTEFPGAVTEATGGECMTDADSDGYGDKGATGLYDVGTDCNDADNTEFPGAVTEATGGECMTDADGDGFGDKGATGLYDVGTDCNDADNTEFPGAVTEATGGECMTDADGDGYGDMGATGLYDVGTDCNDGDNSEFPGAVAEATAGECMNDRDGDGFGDDSPSWGSFYDAGTDCLEGFADTYPGAAIMEPEKCTRDSDGDGWGVIRHEYYYLPNLDAGTDCDDTDSAVYPGAATEEPSLCTADADGDGYAADDAVSPAEAGTDCDDTNSGVYPGAPGLEVSGGDDIDCDGDDYINYPDEELADWDAELLGTPSATGNHYLGRFLEVADWNNDGQDDVYVGGQSMGYIVEGPVSSWGSDIQAAPTSHALNTQGAGFGDIDNDGDIDFLLTGWLSTDDRGAAWLGPVTGALTLGSADFVWDRGGQPDPCGPYGFGRYYDEDVQAGDVDGDGKADLIVGSTTHNGVCNGGSGVMWGAVYVTYGPISSDVSMDDADLILTGTSYPDSFGRYPHVLEDMDGDGIDDLVTSSHRGYDTHVLFDVASHSSGTFVSEADLILSASLSDQTVATSAGDYDGDGYGDLLHGAGRDGAVYLGSMTPSSTPAVTWNDSARSSELAAIAGGGDFDDDGFDDVALFDGYNTLSIFYGGTTGSLDLQDDADILFSWSSTPGYNGNGTPGRQVHFGDFDADGVDDLLVGLPATDDSGYNSGAVLFLAGDR